ncbi:MAG: hypothetical protein KAQ85_11180 [Thermodesulfovibrionia bacterium]|nr:hypothetical protein [Thermodesulfovibrionia bacterium]
MKAKYFFYVIGFCCVLGLLGSSAYAGCEVVLSKNIGWTIAASKSIAGWKDEGKEKKDGFEGCNYGRTIYFSDGTSAVCNSYGEQFLKNAVAIILGKNVDPKSKSFEMLKMIVEDSEYYLK